MRKRSFKDLTKTMTTTQIDNFCKKIADISSAQRVDKSIDTLAECEKGSYILTI